MVKKRFAPPIFSWGVLFFSCLTDIGGQANAAGSIVGAVMARGVKNPADVVVYVEKVKGQFQPAKEPAPMDQVKRVYVPHVLAVLAGTEIEFLNSDNDLHNVHARQSKRELFNISIPPQWKTRRILKDEGIVTLLCDIHPEMSAYILVLQNPFFAKPDEQGNYQIQNVPPGSYTLKAWHENLRPESKEVKVSEGGTARVDFELRR